MKEEEKGMDNVLHLPTTNYLVSIYYCTKTAVHI